MARSKARTLSLLNRWPTVMHADIWRFNQIGGEGVPVLPSFQNPVMTQFERDFIARELSNAIGKFATNLGYYPAPAYLTEEIIIKTDMHWTQQTFSTRFGYLQAFGIRATAEIEASALVVYSDEDSDTVDDTATITVTGVTNIEAEEIQVFYKVTDGATEQASEYWRIEPVLVVKSGDTATITGHRALFTHPLTVWAKERVAPEWQNRYEGDTGRVGDFVTNVDVFRVYTDSTNAIQLHSTPAGGGVQATAATAWITDDRAGDFQLYQASGQNAPQAVPKKVKVNYLAGLPLVDGDMDNEFATAIIRYANLLFPQQPAMTDQTAIQWNDDRAQAGLVPYDGWHPPAMGITVIGVHATNVIQNRHIPLKGLATNWYSR